MEKQQGTPEEMRSRNILLNTLFMAMVLIPALITIFGGIQMCRGRSYGLSVTASILAAIPCLSPSACCLLGMGIGIWALVVLFNPDVKASFR
jgi:hypothetical protein